MNKIQQITKRLRKQNHTMPEEVVVCRKEMKKMYEKPLCEPPTSRPEHQDQEAMYVAEIERLRALLDAFHNETEASRYTEIKKEKQKYDKRIQAKERENYSLKCYIEDLQKKLAEAQQTIYADNAERCLRSEEVKKEDQSRQCEQTTSKANYQQEERSCAELKRVQQLADEFQKENRNLQEENKKLQEENRKLQEAQQKYDDLLNNYNKQVEENASLIYKHNYYISKNHDLEQQLEGMEACVSNTEGRLRSKEVKKADQSSQCAQTTSKANYAKEETSRTELKRVQHGLYTGRSSADVTAHAGSSARETVHGFHTGRSSARDTAHDLHTGRSSARDTAHDLHTGRSSARDTAHDLHTGRSSARDTAHDLHTGRSSARDTAHDLHTGRSSARDTAHDLHTGLSSARDTAHDLHIMYQWSFFHTYWVHVRARGLKVTSWFYTLIVRGGIFKLQLSFFYIFCSILFIMFEYFEKPLCVLVFLFTVCAVRV